MSKYTDWLNEKGTETLENSITAVDFIRVCAWNAKEMAYYYPEELRPLTEEEIPLDQTALNKELADATNELNKIPDDNEEGTEDGGLGKEEYYKAACEEKETERLAEIAATENLIALYGNILADLCIWNPGEPSMKALKAFAIKELTSNMPNMAKYANPEPMASLEGFFNSLYNEKSTVINNIKNKIIAESKANVAANSYIDSLKKDIVSLEAIVAKVPEESVSPISL